MAAKSADLSSEARAGGEEPSAKEEPFLQPWQFFLLGGMLAATATVIVATGQRPENIIILSLTVVSVSFVGLGAYRVLLPLVTKDLEPPPTIAGRTRAALEREKTLVLRSIKELEFDHAMGKVAKADFDEMSARLRGRAMGLLKQLDAGGGYKDQIAREVEARLARSHEGSHEGSHGGSHEGSHGGSDGGSHEGSTCAACSTANDADAKFCKNCGAKL